MSKAKTAGDKATASAETVLENGAAAMKTGLEKALKSYDAFVGYGKDTADVVTKSATVAGKGIESINSEIYSYSKQSIEDAVTATKAVLGSKSVHEAFEFQTDFAKSAFEAWTWEGRSGIDVIKELFPTPDQYHQVLKDFARADSYLTSHIDHMWLKL